MTKPHVRKIKGGPHDEKISIIIPAAGVGRRMKSYGTKPLLKLKKNLTILEHQIKCIKNIYSHAEIIIVVGFESERILNFLPRGIRGVENENYESSNIIRSISMGLRVAIYNNIMIIPGDMVFNQHAINNIQVNTCSAIIDKNNEMPKDIVGVNILNNNIAHFAFGIEPKWSTIAYFSGDGSKLFKKLVHDKKYINYYMFEILNMMIDNEIKILPHITEKMHILKIHNPKDVTSMQTLEW